MNLYLYDNKHSQVIAEIPISDNEIETVNKVIRFLYDSLILDGRYKCMTVCEEIQTYTDEDGSSQLILRNCR